MSKLITDYAGGMLTSLEIVDCQAAAVNHNKLVKVLSMCTRLEHLKLGGIITSKFTGLNISPGTMPKLKSLYFVGKSVCPDVLQAILEQSYQTLVSLTINRFPDLIDDGSWRGRLLNWPEMSKLQTLRMAAAPIEKPGWHVHQVDMVSFVNMFVHLCPL